MIRETQDTLLKTLRLVVKEFSTNEPHQVNYIHMNDLQELCI